MVSASMGLTIWAVHGMPEIQPGDDLAAIVASRSRELRDGDVVAVTSKIVSKAEGRLRRANSRRDAVYEETVRLVAARGETRIVETRHGFVMAAAGVDASNIDPGTVALLPVDPDASARRIRARLFELLGVRVGVIVTDTFGRPWREGVVDAAIGVAGIQPLEDLRGSVDSYGNRLDATVVAVADQVASACELVKGKLSGRPVAVIRGLGVPTDEDGPGAAALVRRPADDMFRLGTAEAIQSAVTSRRSSRRFSHAHVDPEAICRALGAAITAPSINLEPPWRFVILRSRAAIRRLCGAIDGMSTELPGRDERAWAGSEAIARWSATLGGAPVVVVPCLYSERTADAGAEPDCDNHRERQLLSMGASVENLLIAFGGEGLVSCWMPPYSLLSGAFISVLDLPDGWEPMGAVAVGHPSSPAEQSNSSDLSRYVLER